MFLLKKLIGGLLMPLPLLLLLLTVGVFLLWLRRERPWGRRLVTVSCLGLLLASNLGVSARLLAPLEREVAPAALQPGVRYLVLLGHAHSDRPGPALQRLYPEALARLVMAVQLCRQQPELTLVTSGYRGPGTDTSHALVVRQAAIELGLDPARIRPVDGSRDTAEEAKRIAPVVGDAPFYLMTSAAHMPRALALFRARGTQPLPRPVDYRVDPHPLATWDDLLPDPEALKQLDVGGHETLGRLWAWLRRQTP